MYEEGGAICVEVQSALAQPPSNTQSKVNKTPDDIQTGIS